MKTKTVLIASDDEPFVRAVEEGCGRLGLTSVKMGRTAAATEIFPAKSPDLVILDVDTSLLEEQQTDETPLLSQSLLDTPIIVVASDLGDNAIHRYSSLHVPIVVKTSNAWWELEPLVCDCLTISPPANQIDLRQTSDNTVSPKVLVVDDDPDIGLALNVRLAAYGVSVVQAFNGMQGYWSALKERPDVIISDFIMPDGRGDYLINRLKCNNLTKDTPVVVLTGRTRDGRKDFGLEREMRGMGATKFLTKPLDFDDLLRELRRHITIPSEFVTTQEHASV